MDELDEELKKKINGAMRELLNGLLEIDGSESFLCFLWEATHNEKFGLLDVQACVLAPMVAFLRDQETRIQSLEARLNASLH